MKIATAVIGICIAMLSYQQVRELAERAEGYFAGLGEAQWEWDHDFPVLYTYGLGAGVGFDATTGLPIWPVAGCVIDPWTNGLVQSHNKKILDLVAKHGLPDRDLLDHLALIQDPETWFLEQAAHVDPNEIRLDGPPIHPPDQNMTLALVSEDDPQRERRVVKFVCIHPTRTDGGHREPSHLPDLKRESIWYFGSEVERIELLWVRDSTRLAVASYFNGNDTVFYAFDHKIGIFYLGVRY